MHADTENNSLFLFNVVDTGDCGLAELYQPLVVVPDSSFSVHSAQDSVQYIDGQREAHLGVFNGDLFASNLDVSGGLVEARKSFQASVMMTLKNQCSTQSEVVDKLGVNRTTLYKRTKGWTQGVCNVDEADTSRTPNTGVLDNNQFSSVIDVSKGLHAAKVYFSTALAKATVEQYRTRQGAADFLRVNRTTLYKHCLRGGSEYLQESA